MKFLGLTLLIVGAAVSCFAAPPQAPEIDPSSGAAALALVGGALLIIRARRK
jgi:hypothetical protein